MPFVTLLVIGFVIAALGMAIAWIVAVRIDNFGIVDIAWAGAIGVLAVVYVAITPDMPARAWLVLVTAGVWSLRLSTYLYRRIMRHHPTEDSRYQDLRRNWGPALRGRMFWFFQAQGLAAVFFSLPFALILQNDALSLHGLDIAGAALWTIGMAGESAADWQLAAFKANPRNRGRICNVGLWRYSRHPNYFFEWIIWCGFAVMALAAPLGWMALMCPMVMLWLLLRVTGIPATEAAAVARRGDAYRDYQRTTSAFVPWFPRR